MEETIRLARLLGKHLQETAAYKQMQMSRAAVDDDKALQNLIGEFNLKRMNFNQIMSADPDKAESDENKAKIQKLNEEIQKLYSDIMLNPNMQLYADAQGAVSELLEQVNYILSQAANGSDPDLVDPADHCTGDCSSCGSCN